MNAIIAKFMFKPPKYKQINEDDIPNRVQVDDICTPSINVMNKNVYILRVEADITPKMAIVFCHGNMEDCNSIVTHLIKMSKVYRAIVYAVEITGYGPTKGKEDPSMEQCSDDVYTAFAYVNMHETMPKMLWGRSLGCALAIKLATKCNCDGLVLEAPFMSPLMVYLPFHTMLEDEFDNYTEIRHVTCPTIIVHGTEDKVIPWKHGHTLYTRCHSNAKEFVKVIGANHNNIYTKDFEDMVTVPVKRFIEDFVLKI